MTLVDLLDFLKNPFLLLCLDLLSTLVFLIGLFYFLVELQRIKARLEWLEMDLVARQAREGAYPRRKGGIV